MQPLFIVRGAGPCVFDADGREYLDLVGSWGPLILGHAHPGVVDAVRLAVAEGTTFGAPTPREIEIARLLTGALPSVEQVRLVSSGTEATMSAVRVARAATRRSEIVKFAGCYHGHVDALLARAGSGATTLGVPDSPGVPEALSSLTLIVEYNDLGQARDAVSGRGRSVAAILVEPVAANMGVVLPEPGFLEGLRELASESGAVLIFDEVVTGFRLAWGGAQERYDVRPDLTCLGKVIGGGLPVGAFGGRRELMEQVAPAGPVYQAGTLSGNPLATAAGVATLRELRDGEVYARLERLGGILEEGLGDLLRRRGVRACVNRAGSMLTVFFGVDRVTNYSEARSADTGAYARFFRGMITEGIYLPPSQFEAWFLSAAHSEAHVERVLRAAERVLGAWGGSCGAPPPDPRGRPVPPRLRGGSAIRLAAAGMEFAATAGGAVVVGHFLDRHFGTSPWLVMACFVLGLAGGFYRLVQIMRLGGTGRGREGGRS